jgi:hypothetical protein
MIDLTPTRKSYISMLKIVIRNSKNKEDVEWAMEELTRVHRMKFRGEE